MEDLPEDTESIYNDYVNYYNQSGSSKKDHIPIFAELARIEETVKERTSELGEIVEEAISSVINNLESISEEDLYGECKKNKWEEKKKIRDELLNTLKWSNEYTASKYDLLYEVNNLKEKINELYIDLDLEMQEFGTSFLLLGIENSLPKLIQAKHHWAALWILKGKIIDQNYPSQLQPYKDLEEHEKVDLLNNNKVGAPLNAAVPQDEVEEIVTKLLHQYIRGQTITTNKNGVKRMYKVVHDSGKHAGNANINQIFKFFESAHPDLINISDRQFKKRIKKAVPKGMK